MLGWGRTISSYGAALHGRRDDLLGCQKRGWIRHG